MKKGTLCFLLLNFHVFILGSHVRDKTIFSFCRRKLGWLLIKSYHSMDVWPLNEKLKELGPLQHVQLKKQSGIILNFKAQRVRYGDFLDFTSQGAIFFQISNEFRMERYSHILNWCGRIFIKGHTHNRECRKECSFIKWNNLICDFNASETFFVSKKHHYSKCMVISKLWKDIHPRYIRVENNSICWKNIAPCTSAQAFVRPVGKGCKLELATFDILRSSCLQTKYVPLRLRNEDMASNKVSPAF